MYDIIGERIALRKIVVDDTDMVLKWRNSDAVRSYFIYKKMITKEDHLNWLATKVDKGLVEQFIVCDIETDKPFASVYFRDIEKDNHKAEYGVFIGDSQYIGKGYGYEIAKLMIEYGFEKMRLDTITLRVIADNTRAKHCYEKAGFVEFYREMQMINGAEIEVIYMILKKGQE